MTTLDFADIGARSRSSVLSGRAEGAFARAHLKIAELDAAPDPVDVVVPEHFREMTPSFVLGLFSESFKRFSDSGYDAAAIRDQFFRKYRFEEGSPIIADVEAGIDDFVDTQLSLAHLDSVWKR